MNIKLSPLAISLLAIFLNACGGGANAPDPMSPPPASTLTKATVGIVFTDASIDDYDHAYVTITSVELLGNDDGHQLIFSGEERIDLLALRDSVRLFAVSENVDPGDYSKIRLEARDMELVVDNDDGSTTITPIDLVANGKIDLNPRGAFSLAAGDVVFVSLDWDMNQSMKLTETGNGRIIMRPVIFVDVGTEPAFKEGLVRVFGLVELVAADFTAFRLCSPDVMIDSVSDPILGSLCLDIIIGPKTGLFGPDGNPIMLSELAVDDPVTVLGLLQRSSDGPAVSPMEDDGGVVPPTTFQIVAIVVEGGPKLTWMPVRGTLNSVVAADTEVFDFLLDTPQNGDAETILTGQLFATSRIFRVSTDSGITEVGATDLMMGDRAVVESVQVAGAEGTDPDVLNIAIMLARTPGEVELDQLKGEILSVEASENMMMVSTSDGDFCVRTTDDTAIFELIVSSDSIESVPTTLADLVPGSRVGVTGVQEDCLVADLIIAEAPAAP